MTAQIENAIELAYDLLKEESPSWEECANRGYNHRYIWESLIVCSDIPAGPVEERDGELLVHDADGNLVPMMSGGSPGWHSIYDDAKAEPLICKAEDGDDLAHNVLCSIAADFAESGCVMPKRLRGYITEALRSQTSDSQKRRRGRDPNANHLRNFHIANAVLEVVKLGFRATRNREPKHQRDSACSIVAEALSRLGVHLSESSVENAWTRFSREFNEELRES